METGMISTRTHLNGGKKILAACDEEILGKTFKGNGLCITVFESFYGGKIVTEDEFTDMMTYVSIMNLVGNKTVDLAIKAGYVDEKRVLVIGGIKHAQVVKS